MTAEEKCAYANRDLNDWRKTMREFGKLSASTEKSMLDMEKMLTSTVKHYCVSCMEEIDENSPVIGKDVFLKKGDIDTIIVC